MHRDFITTHMKLLLATLFISSYKLPDADRILALLNTKSKRWFFGWCCQKFLRFDEEIQKRQSTLKYLSTSEFLGKYAHQESAFKSFDFPTDESNSCLLFFERIFSFGYSPLNKKELDELLTFAEMAVQFEKSSSERIEDALKLIYTTAMLIETKREQVGIDYSELSCGTKVEKGDTKDCDCYEYEMSGDCSCVFDC